MKEDQKLYEYNNKKLQHNVDKTPKSTNKEWTKYGRSPGTEPDIINLKNQKRLRLKDPYICRNV